MSRPIRDEAYLSTQQPQTQQDSRLSSSDANDGRPKRSEAPSPKRKGQDLRLKGPPKQRFEQIFSQGRRTPGELYRLSSLPGTGLLGIATSKKLGDRPNRHRARRRAQAAIRTMFSMVELKLDYVLIISPTAESATFERIGEELRNLFLKAREKWALELECS